MLFFGKKKMTAAIALFVFMGLSGWFWRHREYIPFVSQPLSVGTAPFQYTVSRGGWMGGHGLTLLEEIWNNWDSLDALQKENESLRAEQAHYSEILAENIRLKELLSFKQGYTQYHLSGASVISRDYGTWTQTLVIDRGADSGIQKYMPVIVPTGLVGFVSEVYANTARVQLLLDPRTSVGGIVQRPASRVVSMVSGNSGRLGELVFVNLPKEADVLKGDTILASGYGGVYPKGMAIGTVEQVEIDEIAGTQVARITPAADFSHLEEVFVITDHIQKAAPESIQTKVPKKEPPMNPNKQQAGEKR